MACFTSFLSISVAFWGVFLTHSVVVNATNPKSEMNNTTVIVLGKNVVDGVCTLTQEMLNKPNSIYVIKNDYVLSSDIFVPNNSSFLFEGGSISGKHIITFQNTFLDGAVEFKNIRPKGNIKNRTSHIKWFLKNGDDASDIIKYLISTSPTVIIDEGTWRISKYIKLSSGISIEGVDVDKCILKFDYERFDTDSGWYGMFGTDDRSMYDKYIYTKKDSDATKKNKRNTVRLKNVTFRNITFDKGPYVNQHACIEFIQAKNCNVNNCVFKYDKGNHNGLCNITASIVQIYSKNCSVEQCVCLDDVLVTSCYSDNITIAHNKLYRVRATGIETLFCTHVYVLNNYVKDNYGRESTIGINAAESVVKDNQIILTGEDGTFRNSYSCLTINHQIENVKAASNIVVENNYLVSKVEATTCLLVQCGKNITIKDNTIRGTVEKGGCLIGILGGVFNNIKVLKNTIEQTDLTINCRGIFLRNNSDLPPGYIIVIGDNSVKAFNGIHVAGIKNSTIINNTIDGVSDGIVVHGKSSVIRNNIINNYANAMNAFCGFSFENNIVQSCGAINVHNTGKDDIKNVQFANNRFEKPHNRWFVNFNTVPQKIKINNNTFDIETAEPYIVTSCVNFSPSISRYIINTAILKQWKVNNNTIKGIASGRSCDIF